MAFSSEIPYRFPEGLRVFILDHDTTQLNTIADMCFQCNYEVTTCTMASFAVHLLRETKGYFDVILIEAQMPDMNSYDFLQRVTQEIKIPIIMMGVDDDTTNARMKAIEKGACEYWRKPLNKNHINNMWQHVATIQEQDQILRILETNRVSWSSPKLHEQFLRVVNQIGIDKAKPKTIVDLMNVPGLTTKHVSSHLQKLRLGLKSSSKKTKLKKNLSKSGRKNSKQHQYHVPNPNESLEVVQSMPAEHDQNVVLNSEVIQCDNNFHAQEHQKLFDDFEVSNMFTDKTNMMLDDLPSLYDEAWCSSEYGTFDWC
ncbi:hypothetical protein TSUD_73380 [Trifolium subterraneum]|uniref:Response regulatory domain-containing protein n=1 Tax=Trifolium subterraneum TaxID=3900 RepID=A0A2Z6LGU9_TRISU|nr:hypothetical protein TSUD_73380 [Trifolium subterraneum]